MSREASRFRVSRPGTTRSGEGYSLRDQVFVPETLTDHTLRDVRHLVNGVALAVVVPTGKLPDIAVQVLGAHVVVGAVVAPLEHGPEGLDPVRVRLIPNVLAD